jgi:predicted Ser/Thr protein kinase
MEYIHGRRLEDCWDQLEAAQKESIVQQLKGYIG